MTEASEQGRGGARSQSEGQGGTKRLILGFIVVIFLASLGGRAWLKYKGPGEQQQAAVVEQDSGTPGLSTGLVQKSPQALPGLGGPAEPDPEPKTSDQIAASLPYVTEGSFFALIGYGLGYLSRKLVKVALVVMALLFVAIQGLQYAGIITGLDWGRAVDLFNQVVLNLKENSTLGEVLKDRVPSVGGLMAGYLLGYKKG